MNSLRDAAAVAAIEDERSLLDAELLDLVLASDEGRMQCSLRFRTREDRSLRRIKVECLDVKRFDFNLDDETTFFVVERYKLLARAQGGYYLALDPYDEREDENEEDAAVIVCGSIRLQDETNAHTSRAA